MTHIDIFSLALSLAGVFLGLGLGVKTLIDTRKIQVKCANA